MSTLNGDTTVILHQLVHSLGVSLYCSIIILRLKCKKYTITKMQVVTFSVSVHPSHNYGESPAITYVYGPNRDSPEFYDGPFRHNDNNILYSSQQEIKAVIWSHNKEQISIILSHETHTHSDIHILTLRHTPPFSQSAYTNSKPKII